MEKEIYYISTGDYVGNAILWWRPNSQGYTTDIRQAGKYTREKAESICRTRSTEKAYLCSTIDSKADAQKLIIDGQYLGSEDLAFNLHSLESKK